MRSKPERSDMRKVAIVLLILALLWLIAGIFFLVRFRGSLVNAVNEAKQQQEEQNSAGTQDGQEDLSDQDGQDNDSVVEDLTEDSLDITDDDAADTDDADDADPDDADDEDDPADDTDDNPDDDQDNDSDDADDEDEDDVETFTVDAWDGFAAVRAGRGTGYQQVGRLNNGETVKVTDLDDGWYKIASGKWKGYYLHMSSLK